MRAQFITASEVAEIMGISRSKAYQIVREMLVFFCHDTNNLLDKNLGHATRLAHIGTQRKCCPHTKTPPMSC